jgi:hypothetical protein
VSDKERYESSWELSLRGGGPRLVAVGHLFSGIECEVDAVPPVPRIVRKPRFPGSKAHKTGPMIEESAAILARRKRLSKKLKEIRPHNMTYQMAENLVAASTDLFQWAEESTQQFFDQKAQIAANEGADNNSSVGVDDVSVAKSAAGSIASARFVDPNANLPFIEFRTNLGMLAVPSALGMTHSFHSTIVMMRMSILTSISLCFLLLSIHILLTFHLLLLLSLYFYCNHNHPHPML